MKRSNWTPTRAMLAIIACCILTTVAFGQDMEKGTVEATGHVGLVAGIGTHGTFGGSVGTAVNDKIFAFGEFSYIPLGGGQVAAFGFQSGGSAKAYNFIGGAQYMFRRNEKTAPYAGGGLGILHSSSKFTATVGGTTTSISAGGTDVYLNLGGGVRYYSTDRWGFKPEVMIFVGSNTFVRLSGGLFYQFGRK